MIMAKAVPLTLDILKTAPVTPLAATPPRSASTPALDEVKATKADNVPLQIRIPKEIARAIKIEAARNDQSISDFMLACFHAYKTD